MTIDHHSIDVSTSLCGAKEDMPGEYLLFAEIIKQAAKDLHSRDPSVVRHAQKFFSCDSCSF